ncbi:hypothetical protein BB561_000357 [Smittium simulii]|uniref:Proline dehydrogenase n=1 Tax=Smittium simulii TaxID=133385 RepID=A0A2T9YZG7_9FUNG|nr:hypothetical protein BB561_000357 [Smittium simulii]
MIRSFTCSAKKLRVLSHKSIFLHPTKDSNFKISFGSAAEVFPVSFYSSNRYSTTQVPIELKCDLVSHSKIDAFEEINKTQNRNTVLTIENYGSHLKSYSLPELLTASFVYKCCTMKWLVELSPKLIDLANILHMSSFSHAIVKKTFFKIFCAGENKAEVEESMRKLHNVGINSILDLSIESDLDTTTFIKAGADSTCLKNDVKVVSNRMEENKRADYLVKEYVHSIEMAATQPDSFVAIKVTGLVPPASMYRLSLRYMTLNRTFDQAISDSNSTSINYSSFIDNFILKLPDNIKRNTLSDDYLAYCKSLFENLDTNKDGLIDKCDFEIGLNLQNKLSQTLYLSDTINVTFAYKESSTSQQNSDADISGVLLSDFEDYTLMEKRVFELSSKAKSLNVQLMVDAEHSYFQPLIDQVALSAMRFFNSYKSIDHLNPSSDYYDAKPTVFNTYQMYTKSAFSRLMSDFEKSQRQNWAFGAKLVRGAYMEQERELALKLGYISPINNSLYKTHISYNDGVKFMLNQISQRQKKLNEAVSKPQNQAISHKIHLAKNPSLFVASHNHNSIELAVSELKSLKIDPTSRTVSFAQLLGMQDAVSFKLAEIGMNIYKYVPYGPIEETLPYLIRRAQENSSILESASKEVQVINSEIINRIKNI